MPTSLPSQYTYARRQRHRAHRHALLSAGKRWRCSAMMWRLTKRSERLATAPLTGLASCPQNSHTSACLPSFAVPVYIKVHIDTHVGMHLPFKFNGLE